MPGAGATTWRADVRASRVLAALAAGAAVRLALLRLPVLWYDEATTGVMGLAVLRGDLPVYFYGQPFMGALDAYLSAPLYATLGVSAHTLKLLPILLSIAWLGLSVRLAWEAFGPAAAWCAALAFAVPPDFLLYWSHQARPHYPLAMTLGALALCLAARAPLAPAGRARLRFGILGLVLGLAFWTNYLALVYFPAVGVLLLLRGGLRPLARGSLVAVPAFVLGSLPHWLYGLSRGAALPPPGSRIHLADLLAHLRVAGRVSWPILAGVPVTLREAPAGVVLAIALGGLYALAALAALRAWREGPPAGRPVALALLTLLAVSLGVAVGTRYGRGLDDPDQRYLLPLYTALPALAGRWLAGRATRAAALALGGALLLVHAAGALGGTFRTVVPALAAAEREALAAQRATVDGLERAGLRRVYAPDVRTRILTFLSAERVVFSSHYEEIVPGYARAVDAAPEIGWWTDQRSAVLEAHLAALGARFTFRPVPPLGGAYVGFTLPPGRVRELDPAGFAVTASEDSGGAARVVDRDAQTLWGTGLRQRGGEWLQVDLGRIAPVALVRWLPGTYQEVPGGLRLETSLDGRAWQRLVELPQYVGPLYWSATHPMARVRSGRVELRVPPTPARYLRVTQTASNPLWGWTVRELFVYADAGEPAARPVPDGQTLARAVRAAGVSRLYADHGWGSRVALADPTVRVLPANRYLDAYGFEGSARDLLPPVRWGPGHGALLEAEDVEGFERVAREAGLGVRRQAAGGLTLFVPAPPPPAPGAPVPAGDLRVTASRRPEAAALAVDGDRGTRWGSGHPQTPGDWVRVDLVAPRAVRAVRLWTTSTTDAPRGLRLEASEDGVSWAEVAAERHTEGPLRWGGIALLRDGIEAERLDFAPRRVRALRLSLTRGDPVFDWSIHELTVYAAE